MDNYIFICVPVFVFLSILVGTIKYSKGRLEVNKFAQYIVGSLGVGNYILYSYPYKYGLCGSGLLLNFHNVEQKLKKIPFMIFDTSMSTS